MTEYIEAEYKVGDRGRKLTGVARSSWDWRSCIELVNSDQSQEKVRHRDLFGYLGHSYREAYGLCPPEVMIDANGVKILEPSHVTVDIEGDLDKGVIYHKAEVLDNQFGKTISKLNKNRMGGFSVVVWNEPNGAMLKPTEFYGWDYVYIPNYSGNRGYKSAAMAQMDSGNPILKPVAMFGDFYVYGESLGALAGQAQMDDAFGSFQRQQEQANAMIMHLQNELDRTRGVISSHQTRASGDAGDLQRLVKENSDLTRRIQQLERSNRSIRQYGALGGGRHMDSGKGGSSTGGLILPEGGLGLLRLSELGEATKKSRQKETEKPYVPPLNHLGY